MKNLLLIAACSLFLFGCNMNPSKEARIQKLETELEQTMSKIDGLEEKVQELTLENEILKVSLNKLKEQE